MTAIRAFTTVPEIAASFGVSQHSVLGWIARGELAAINVARRTGRRPSWRISREALERFEAVRAATPRPAVPRTRRTKSPVLIEFF
jgi:excisionase family DNA binding protein